MNPIDLEAVKLLFRKCLVNAEALLDAAQDSRAKKRNHIAFHLGVFTHYDDTARIQDLHWSRGIQDFHWSPDGKKLGIIRVKRSADAVLFRDVKK